MVSKNYSNTAAQVSLTSSVNAVATTLPVSATTGFPAPNFTLVLGAGTVNEELVLVTNVAGTNLTVTRGYDNTTAVAHDSGTVVQHAHSAEDFALSRAHEAATSGVHGVAGALVGAAQAQALTNKDLTSGTNTFPSTFATKAGTETLTNKTISAGSNTLNGFTPSQLLSSDGTGKATSSGKAIPSGAVVGTTDIQTLTNKTLTGAVLNTPTLNSPTVSGVGEVLTAFKTVDESISSATLLQNDDALWVDVDAGVKYLLTGFLIVNGGTSSNIHLGFSCPSGATVRWSQGGYSADSVPNIELAVTDADASARPMDTAGVGTDLSIRPMGFVTTSAAGTLALSWAQVVSSATATTIKAGSWIRLERVA